MMQNDPSFILGEEMPAAGTDFDLALDLHDLHHLGMSSPRLPTFQGRERDALKRFPSSSSKTEGEEPLVPQGLADQQWCANHLPLLVVLCELCGVLATPNCTTTIKGPGKALVKQLFLATGPLPAR